MGAAALHRGNRAIRAAIENEARPVELEIMGRLNALEKYKDASAPPFDGMVLADDGKRWWALNPDRMWAGNGYAYKTLHEAVKRWDVVIVGYVRGVWVCANNRKEDSHEDR